jgi:NADH-quinone oxidoreductase subunit H
LGIGTYIVVSLIKIAIALWILLTAVAYIVLMERKLVGRIQNRWGPTRVGPFGMLQPLADGAKFLLKEDITPPYVYKPLYMAAPMIALVLALTSIAVIPVGNWVSVGGVSTPLQVTDVNVGLLIILGITSMGVYGVALAGWSSNSKYSLLGSLRASAQMVSYEVSLGLALIGVLILSGSFSLREIVDAQAGTWWGWLPKWNFFQGQFVAFFIYLTAAFAETNRVPFDLPEAETELVAGYHTEYSAMKFAMFYLAEYTHMMTTSFLAVALFLGGWHFPWIATAESTGIAAMVIKVIVVAVKMGLFILFFMLIRWTLPRFRFDQLMKIAWKALIPLALVNLVWVMIVEHLVVVAGWPGWLRWLLLPISIGLAVVSGYLSLRPKRPGVHRIQVVRGHEVVEMTV